MNNKLKAFGIYQIIGGAISLAITIYAIFLLASVNILLVGLFIFALGICCFSIYCGYILFKDPMKGLQLSNINQFLQLIQFSGFGFAFKYLSGVSLCLAVTFSNPFNIHLGLNFLSTYQIIFDGLLTDLVLSINFVALFFILWIRKIKIKIKEEEDNAMVNYLIEDKRTDSIPLP